MSSKKVHFIERFGTRAQVACGRLNDGTALNSFSTDTVTCDRCRDTQEFEDAVRDSAPTKRTKKSVKKNATSQDPPMPEHLYVQQNSDFDKDGNDTSFGVCTIHEYDTSEHAKTFSGKVDTEQRVAVYTFLGWTTIRTTVQVGDLIEK